MTTTTTPVPRLPRRLAATAAGLLAVGALSVLPSAAPAGANGMGGYVDPMSQGTATPLTDYRAGQDFHCGVNVVCGGAPVSGPGAPMVDFP